MGTRRADDPPEAGFYGRGILSGPVDMDPRRRTPASFPTVEARPGLEVEVRGARTRGRVVAFGGGTVTLRGDDGRDRRERLVPGGFQVDGRQVTLVAPRASAAETPRTASGSVAVAGAPARVARASRILVEGVHDAELVERVWGDDLRVEGIVVEPLQGADHLDEVVRAFGPRPGRRLGILLDHLVEGTKEWRLAAGVDHPDVLITGHPYVDVWAGIKPERAGLDRWPDVPRDVPWKQGICAAVGVDDPARFWKQLLGSVRGYADLEPPLVGAVEQLIDFVAEPSG